MTTAAYDTFIRDPGRVPITLMEVQAWVIQEDEAITLYYSSADFATEVGDTPSNQRYETRIIGGFSMSAVMDGVVSSLVGLMPARDGGTIELFQINGDLDRGESLQLVANGDVSFHDLSFGGRPVVIKHGGYSPQLGRSLTYDEYAVLLDGRCDGDPKGVEDRFTFKLATKDRNFEQILQPRVFSGYGPALHFNGTSTEISFGTVLDFTSSDFTWKFSMFIESAPGSTENFIFKGNTAGTNGYRLGVNSSQQFVFRTAQAAAFQETVSGTIPLFQMVDVVLVRDGASAVWYIEGARSVSSSGTHIDPDTAVGRNLYFGRNNDASTYAGPFLMTEVACWDRALTKDEVNGIIHRRLDEDDLADADLVFYAPMNEGTGANVEETVAVGSVAITGGYQWVHSSTGQPDIEGENVPDPWGPQFNWSPRLLDPFNGHLYMVSGEEIDGFAVWDGLAETDPDSTLIGPICENGYPGIPLDTTKGTGGNFGSYIAFLLSGNEPAAGKHTTCITSGGSYIRMRNKPSGTITVNFNGNAPGGVYMETTADQIEWVIQNRGSLPLSAGELVAAAFTQYNVDAPQVVGHMYEGGETISEFINFALRSTGGLGWFAREGGDFAIRVNKGADDAGLATPTVTLTQDDVSQLTCLDRSKPIWRVEANHSHNPQVMGTSDMLPSVVSHKRSSFLRHEWRTAKQNRLGTRQDFLDSLVMIVNTGLTNRDDAQAEATRLSNIYRFRDRAFRFLTKFKVNFDRMDRVYFHFQGQIDQQGNIGDLLATHSALPFLVMEVTDDPETGGSWITLWRQSR